MALSPGGDIYSFMKKNLYYYTKELSEAIIDSSGGMIHLLVTLFFIFGFIGIMTHKLKKDMAISIVLIPILWTLISQGTLYLDYCCYPFLDFAESASSFLIGFTSKADITDIPSLFQELDKIFGKLWETLMSLSPSGGILKDNVHVFKVQFALGLVALIYLLVYICFFVVLCTSVFSMHLLFILGGPFIFLAAFQKTRHLTMNWVKAQFTYALTIIFATLTMALCLHGFDLIVTMFSRTEFGDKIFTSQYLAVVAMAALAFMMVLKSSSIAASLTGGQADNNSGVGQALSAAGGAVAGAVGGAALGRANQMTDLASKPASNVLSKVVSPVADKWKGLGGQPKR